jgi:ATP-dependent Lon protease
MTGEITLRGRVLSIGGLKEKVMAAFREEIKTVLFPFGNKKDLEDIPKDIQSQIELVPVRDIGEVLSRALLPVSTKSKRKAPWRVPLPPEITSPTLRKQGSVQKPLPGQGAA